MCLFKFYFKIDENARQTFKLINFVIGDDSLSRSVTFHSFKYFKESWIFIEDNLSSGCTSTSRTDDAVSLFKKKLEIINDCQKSYQ